jgi:hypothetical protein
MVIQLSFPAFHRIKIIPPGFEKAKLTDTAARLYNFFRAVDSRGHHRALRFVSRGGEHCPTMVEFSFQCK